MNNKINYVGKCPSCGQGVVKYWHSLTLGLAVVLKRFAFVAVQQGNKVHLPYDVALTKTEYNNFQKLQYFGLVNKYYENGHHPQGFWSLTERGRQFIVGEKGVPNRVQTNNSKIVGWSLTYITYQQVSKKPYFEDLGHFLETAKSTIPDNQMSLIGGNQ